MKKPAMLIALLALASAAQAQLQVNPQLGITLTDLTNDQPGVESKAAVGFQLGADLRVGGRFYFQPGAHFGRSATTVKYAFSDTTVIEDNLIRTTLKAKALVGFNLIHSDAFKLRVNAGPTYEVLLSVDSKDDEIEFNKDDYNAGSFNMDAGVGVDLAILTAETGISYGLSNAYKDAGELTSDVRYFTFYVTLGVVIGSAGD
jgi:hypothetical protein